VEVPNPSFPVGALQLDGADSPQSLDVVLVDALPQDLHHNVARGRQQAYFRQVGRTGSDGKRHAVPFDPPRLSRIWGDCDLS
jgi:hypothetical protein